MNLFGKKRIFLDHAGGKENPSGIHEEGREARRRLEEARTKVARILKCQTRDVIFTSGGTESNNLAILGVFSKGAHVIIGENEHPSIVEPAREFERRGGELTITSDPLKHIKDNTVLVSMAYASNETGAINNVPKLARLIKDYRNKKGSKYPLIHTDASAAYEYLDVDINKLPADLITLEKVLVVRPIATLRPMLLGGGQERGLRSGTENVIAIEEFAKNLEAAEKTKSEESERLYRLKKEFVKSLSLNFPDAVINTPLASLPHIVSVTFPGKLHEFVAIKLDAEGVAVSVGSACNSGKDEPDKESIRFSFGPKTSEAELKEAIRILRKIML